MKLDNPEFYGQMADYISEMPMQQFDKHPNLLNDVVRALHAVGYNLRHIHVIGRRSSVEDIEQIFIPLLLQKLA